MNVEYIAVEFGNVNSEHSHYSLNEIQKKKKYIHRSRIRPLRQGFNPTKQAKQFGKRESQLLILFIRKQNKEIE